MGDEFVIEETRLRVELEKMDTAFCKAMLRAIDWAQSTVRREFAKNRAHDGRSLCKPVSTE
jgi:hypothetical protein